MSAHDIGRRGGLEEIMSIRLCKDQKELYDFGIINLFPSFATILICECVSKDLRAVMLKTQFVIGKQIYVHINMRSVFCDLLERHSSSQTDLMQELADSLF